MIISLTGFMAAGKSTIGKKLAKSLDCKYIDLDEYIEEKEKNKIVTIFEEKGERQFRALEEKYLQDILEEHIEKNPYTLDDLPPKDDSATSEGKSETEIPKRKCTLLLSLGGGTVMNPVCAKLIADLTYCIFIKTDLKTIFTRLKEQNEIAKRPVLSKQDIEEGVEATDPLTTFYKRIEGLYEERLPLYEKVSRKIIKL
ncbi:MAG: shikimate kinase [Bacteroidales bacterium]